MRTETTCYEPQPPEYMSTVNSLHGVGSPDRDTFVKSNALAPYGGAYARDLSENGEGRLRRRDEARRRALAQSEPTTEQVAALARPGHLVFW